MATYTYVVPEGEQYAGTTWTFEDRGIWDPTKVYTGAHDDEGDTVDSQGNPIVGAAVHYQGGIFFAHYWNTDMNPMFDLPGYSGVWFQKPGSPPVYGEGIKPLAPTGVEAGEVTDDSVVLFWNPAEVQGPQQVSSYNIYVDDVKVGTSTTTSFKIEGLNASTDYTFRVDAVNGAGVSPKSNVVVSTDAPQVENGKYYSPYIDMTLPSTNLIELARDSNLSDFTLAFIQTSNTVLDTLGFLEDGAVPSLAWGGIENTTLPTGAIIKQIQQVQDAGGTITISLGGYTGRDLAVTCADYSEDLQEGGMSKTAADTKAANLLQKLYQSVIDTYGVTHLDFDVENSVHREHYTTSDADVEATKIPVVDDVAANILRYRAINGLKAANEGLHVSLTVATHPDGVSDTPSTVESADPRFHEEGSGNVKALIKLAKTMGVDLDVVNIMAMDYFDGATANPDMGDNAIKAAKAMHALLVDLGIDAKVGITPMLGQNDAYNGTSGGPGNEVFSLEDAQDLVDFFASTPWVAGIGAWQLTRDRQNDTNTTGNGPGTVGSAPVSDSTGVIQDDFEFSSILEKIALWRSTGGKGDDTIEGTKGADTLLGNGGNDTIKGGAGSDVLKGGTGNDKLYGESSADTLEGGTGDDLLDGGSNNDTLKGEAGKDTLKGGTGNDTLSGGSSADTLAGGDGDDSLDGGSNNDTLTGDAGNDTLKGGTGNDTLSGGTSVDILEGGDGVDLLDGGSSGDTLRGGAGKDSLIGGTGNDKLYGDADVDSLYGGTGADQLRGGTGADTFIYKSAAESTIATTGRDTIYDFLRSEGDRIDLSAIDANANAGGNQSFTFVGTAAFSSKAGQLRIDKQASDTIVYGDLNGDGVADFAIHLDDAINLVKGDFLL